MDYPNAMTLPALPSARVVPLLALADRMRRVGCPEVQTLQRCALEVSPLDQGVKVYRHAAIHAGLVTPRTLPRFNFCPECEAKLDWPGKEAV